MVGGVVQRRPQTFDGRVQAVFEIEKSIGRPKLFLQFLARHQLAPPIEQHLQDSDRLSLQAHAHSFPAQFPGTRIELIDAKAHDFWPDWFWLDLVRHCRGTPCQAKYIPFVKAWRHVTTTPKPLPVNRFRYHLHFTSV